MADQEGIMELLSGDSSLLSLEEEETSPVPQGDMALALPELGELDEWAEDPVGVAWNKIRSVFLRAKSPAQLFIEARNMSTGQWLDYAMKMAPKDLKVTAEFSFKHLLEELGPIDKEKYRVKPQGQIVDAEFSEVE